MGNKNSKATKFQLNSNDKFFKSSIDDAFIYYNSWKPNAKPKALVLACHGLGEHCNRYNRVFSEFARSGYGVISLDFRGHGRTFVKNAGLKTEMLQGDLGGLNEKTMGDLKQLVDSVTELEPSFEKGLPLFIFGHSMGGLVALSLTQAFDFENLRGLIISAPALRPYSLSRATFYALKLARFVIPNLQDGNQLDLSALSSDPQILKEYNLDPLVHDRLIVRTAWEIISGGETVLNTAANFNKFPLLLVHGEADRITSFQASKEFYEKLEKNEFHEFLGFPNKLHELHNEMSPFKEELLQKYVQWMDKTLARKESLEIIKSKL